MILKYIKILSVLVIAIVMTACSGGNDNNTTISETIETIETIENSNEGTCNLKEGVPKTDRGITVVVTCSDISVIESAIVTVNGVSKNVDFSADSFTDFIGFGALKANKNYEVQLEVKTDLGIIFDAIRIKTEKKKENKTSILHNGTLYKSIISSTTGRIWLDRNLGATRSCETFEDSACYGDYYQWGRNFDGHQDKLSTTTTLLSTSIADVGHGDFIIVNNSSLDWTLLDADGSERSLAWSKLDGSSVCPVSFRVPTMQELLDETEGVNILDTLNFALSGRHSFNGLLEYQNSLAFIWSSDVNGNNSLHLDIWADFSVNKHIDERSSGRSIRCIKG